VFKTFSAADLHWDSLNRCYDVQVYTAWKNSTPQERIRISRRELRDNPHIAAYLVLTFDELCLYCFTKIIALDGKYHTVSVKGCTREV
jgi:hypothetical protein